MRCNGRQYFYQKNGQDDIIGIVDEGGKVVVQYSNDSWGKLLEVTGDTALGNANPFRYRSYYYDNEIGFYYLGGRYYDAEVGRFINADTTELLTATPAGLTDKNLYAYCDNNPIVRKDEGGAFWLAALGGALYNVATDFITSAITGQEYTLKDAAFSALSGAVGAIPLVGAVLSGAISGSYAMYKSYKDGGGSLEIVVNGALSGIGAAINADNLAKGTAKVAKVKKTVEIDDMISNIADKTFGFGYSCISAATSQAMSNNRQQKKSNAKRKPAKATSRIEKLREQAAARRRLV